MGVEANALRFILSAWQRGVTFTRVATIGRQRLLCRPRQVRSAAREFGLSDIAEQALTRACGGFADPLWVAIGAKEIVSIDASDYEGASVVHDMNDSIPDNLRRRFDAVFDFGSLEHIFNFPVAIKNCMEMPLVKGRLFSVLPASNYCGHGFYQFSPELFYRLFGDHNGYHLEQILLAETGAEFSWYTVPDASAIGQRTMFSAPGRFLLMTEASRQRDTPLLQEWPQQSDYQLVWHGGKVQRSHRDSGALTQALSFAAATLERLSPARHIISAMRNAHFRLVQVRTALAGKIISDSIRQVKILRGRGGGLGKVPQGRRHNSAR